VACGVVDHSGYGRHLWRRLVGTLRPLYLIAFADKKEAEQAGAAVQAVHARVHGTTSEQLGPFRPGTPYSAHDPELMLWVPATLVQSSLAAYERFVRPLAVAHRLATAHILPARLRREYGLRRSPLHELTLPVAGRAVRDGTTSLLSRAPPISDQGTCRIGDR
jgi:uncharacterized protein (DUF2236 family)